MKVGDLVVYKAQRPEFADDTLGFGIVLGFDKDHDPLIYFNLDLTPTPGGDAFFGYDVEVISESR